MQEPDEVFRRPLEPLHREDAKELPREGREEQPILRHFAPAPQVLGALRAVVPSRLPGKAVGAPPPPTAQRLVTPPDAVEGRTRGDTIPDADWMATVRQHTSLGIRVRGRSEMGGVWDRFTPCVGAASQRCDPGVAPRLDPDLRLGVQVGGTILDRVHLTVDYDGTREFDTSNDIRIRYEGAPGELIRRVDAGNVSLAMPAARYLGAAVPAHTWGVRALAQTGPVEWQALWAQGGGEVITREFRLGEGGGARQQITDTWDDADYAGGQFFFLFDPARIRAHPHLDVLTLQPEDAPAAWAPAAGVRLFRFEGGLPQRDGSTTTLRAVPEPDAAGPTVSGAFRLLQEGEDYHLHRSGLWIALRQPLRDDEALAVAYRTRAGGTVGDPNAGGPAAEPREVRLLRAPRLETTPATGLWSLEMRHLYRVSGSAEIAPADLEVVISRGEVHAGDLGRPLPGHGVVPYLRLLGLDGEAPHDRIDPDRIYRPGLEAMQSAVTGTYVVFPTLRPFAEPGAVPVLGLTAEQVAQALGDARNQALYQAVDRRARSAAARYRLRFSYRTASSGDAGSAISLGTVGIREGSERVTAGGRVLARGRDYDIDYALGRIELRGIASSATNDLRVSFEQIPLFAARPVQVAALGLRAPLGDRGELSLIGMSQRERSLLRRPTLGLEADALLVGGAEARYTLPVPALDRLFGGRSDSAARGSAVSPLAGPPAGPGSGAASGAPFHGTTGRSSAEPGAGRSTLRLTGELAASMGDPRSDGIAFLDDFEDGGDIEIPLLRHAWRLGSAPARRDRAEHLLPEQLDVASAGALVWQHDYLGASGRIEGSLPLRDIDRRIRATGRAYEANVLYLSMLANAPRAWRSITTVLSPAGRDLRNHAYLELYLRPGSPGDALVVDLGTVSEDAFAFDAAGTTGGIDAHGRPWGLGILDQEWDPVREAWTAAADERGLWNADCRAATGGVYPLGDPRANCTRGNGVADTEDLNGNGVLDTEERVLRYVVRTDDPDDPNLVAGEEETGTGFRLIRIPLDPAAGVGAAGDELRRARHLRLTVVSGGGEPMVLARMRFVGSRWERRGESGIVRGLVGAGIEAAGRVEVGGVSLLDGSNEYQSPPGTGDAPHDPAGTIGSGRGAELNEKAMRIRYRELEGDARAEVYRRYESGPQSFLGYRELRLWALARQGGWGDTGEQLLIRVGTDAENAYLFRTPLPRRGVPASPDSWRPEIVIELHRWVALREEAERRLRDHDPADGPLVLWDDAGAYGVAIREPGRAPNLAAIRELAVSVYNPSPIPATGELWINEFRLAGREHRPDLAGGITLDLQAADAARVRLGYTRRGAHFRSLGAQADFQRENALFVDAEIDLARLLPHEWGIEAPLTIYLQHSGRDPLYLEGTDLGPGSIHDRRLGDISRRIGWRLRRREEPDASRWTRATVDNVTLHFEAMRSENTTPYTEQQALETSAGIAYDVRPLERSIEIIPGGFRPIGWLARSDDGTSAHTPLRLRWTPVRIGFGTTWSDAHSDQLRFGLAGDASAPSGDPLASRSRRLMHHLSFGIQPFGSMTGSMHLRSGNDLLPSAMLNPAAVPALDAERIRIGGLDLGREAERSAASRLTWSPRLTTWLTQRSSYNGTFALDAHPAYIGPLGEGGGASGVVPLRSFGLRRVLSSRWSVDARALGEVLGIGADSVQGGGGAALGAVLGAMRSLEVGWGNTAESRFERSPLRPGLGYGLGLDAGSLRHEDAAVAADRTSWTARSVIDLPASLAATVEYTRIEADLAGPRGDRSERDRDWPNLALRWSGAARDPDRALRSGSVALGYSRREHRFDDLRSAQQRRGETTTVPADVSLTWAGGITVSYRGEWRGADATTPTSGTGQTAISHVASVSGALAVPEILRDLLPHPVTASFRIADGVQRDCRLSDELIRCNALSEYAGYRERGWSLRLDTRTPDTTFGLRLERRNRVDIFGEPLRHRHLTLSLFGEFVVAGGVMP